jgi:transcriptional regulator with XRE-family HTH domain
VIDGLGGRIGEIRRRRGRTQAELAESAGYSLDFIARIEAGTRDVKTETLLTFARVLNVHPADFFTVADDEDGAVDDMKPQLLPLRRLLIPGLPVSYTDDVEPTPANLRDRVLALTVDYNNARYEQTVAAIPSLVASINAAIGSSENERKAEAQRLLAHVFIIAAQVLIQFRAEDLACVALRQAMDAAEQAGDTILRAATVRYLTWAFSRQGRFEDAIDIAVRMAAEIEPPMTGASRDHLAVWGRLLVGGSSAAAMGGKEARAQELLSMAHSAAVRLPDDLDYAKYWATFNSGEIGFYAVENAMILGDAPRALHLAGDAKRVPGTHFDTWLGHLLFRAQAETETRDYGNAIRTTQAIHQQAPEWLRTQRRAHRVVTRLLDATTVRRQRSSGLRAVADFMDIKP